MGKNSQNLTNAAARGDARRNRLVAAAAAFAATAIAIAIADPPKESPVPPATEYIRQFELGQTFKAPAQGLTDRSSPDPRAVQTLAEHLGSADAHTRENIVSLLANLGSQTDPLQPEGAEVVRDEGILDALTGPGLATPDAGREAAMDALRKLATVDDLRKRGDLITNALVETPTEEAFLLAAKAKPPAAKEPVEELADKDEWKGVEAVEIAKAALGDESLEAKFIEAVAEAEAAGDAEAFTRSIGTLGLIGTPRCLTEIGSRMRTPIVFEVPGAFEKSARLNVMEALLYNFPDRPILYPNNVATDADYLAVERFCETQLGVTFEQPRPEFLTYFGHPIPG